MNNPNIQTVKLDPALLRRVSKPGRYTGGEWNSCNKQDRLGDPALLRFAFLFPDTYEIGMSNQALKLIYELLNREPDVWCERAFAPWDDMEAEMRSAGMPLFTLESRTPLSVMDVLGFTLQYELSYTNILNMLDLAGVPLRAAERTAEDPLVCFGGQVVYNAEPMADFADFMVIGDGEEVILRVLDEVRKVRRRLPDGRTTIDRNELLPRLARLEGVYVPSLYDVAYGADGQVEAIRPLRDDIPGQVRKVIVTDAAFRPERPLVPTLEVVHDRIFLEIFRGCPRGCRFCQAGMACRPMREVPARQLVEQAESMYRATGYDEISLLSLSTSDYSELPELTHSLLERFEDKHVSLSLPSLRLDSMTLGLLNEVSSNRRSGLTFAPEAGSQRLRDVINKGITEQDLMETMSLAFGQGWDRVKLYFMLGLPTETDEDVLAIAGLARQILDLYQEVPRSGRKRRLELTISTALFVPKPDTPFQWSAQVPRAELARRVELLTGALPRSVKYNWHEPDDSYWEAVLARGDRRLADVVEGAWRRGQRFDGWSDHFNADNWQAAMDEAGLDADFFALRERAADEVLPWDHIDSGVNKTYLKLEWQRAKAGKLTPECRDRCNYCGAQVYQRGICPTNPAHDTGETAVDDSAPVRSALPRQEAGENRPENPPVEEQAERRPEVVRLRFARGLEASWNAHLDIMRLFERALTRAGMPLYYSAGYNPRPQLVFALPLGVGLETDGDYVDVQLEAAVPAAELMERLNDTLPQGYRILAAWNLPERPRSIMGRVMAAAYELSFPGAGRYAEALRQDIALPVMKRSKRGEREVDIRPLVREASAAGLDCLLVLTDAGSRSNLRPELLLEALVVHLGLDQALAESAGIRRRELFAETTKGLTPLDRIDGIQMTEAGLA